VNRVTNYVANNLIGVLQLRVTLLFVVLAFSVKLFAAVTNLLAWDGQYELVFKDGEDEPGEQIYHFCLRLVGRVTPCAPSW